MIRVLENPIPQNQNFLYYLKGEKMKKIFNLFLFISGVALLISGGFMEPDARGNADFWGLKTDSIVQLAGLLIVLVSLIVQFDSKLISIWNKLRGGK
jgi:hypothetical protein